MLLGQLFQRINENIEFDDEDMFIRNDLDMIPNGGKMSKITCMVTILIQGYNVSRDRIKPIWKIIKAEDKFEEEHCSC